MAEKDVAVQPEQQEERLIGKVENLLILGGQFQISLALHAALIPHREDFSCRSLPLASAEDLDAACNSIMQDKPDYLFLAASEYDLDKAMRDLYTQTVERVIEICRADNIALVFVSDYQVFDGIKHGSYDERDPVSPYNRYGRWMFGLEQLIRANVRRYLILRSSWVYSAHGDNYLTRLLDSALQEHELIFDAMPMACPTSSNDIAAVLVAILQQQACGAECWGDYHYSSFDATTGYQFAEAVLAVAGQYDRRLVEPGVQIRERPGAHSVTLEIAPVVLSCRKVLETFGIKQRSWRAGIAAVVREVYAAKQQKPLH